MTKKQSQPKKAWPIYLWPVLIIWIFSGLFGLWLHNDVLYWIWGLYVVAFGILAYKKDKNLDKIFSGAQVIKEITSWKFDLKKWKLLSSPTNWLIMTYFPFIFLLYYLDWKMLLIYTIMCTLWHGLYFRK